MISEEIWDYKKWATIIATISQRTKGRTKGNI